MNHILDQRFLRSLFVFLLLHLGATGCATVAEGESADAQLEGEVNIDPFEPVNRAIFKFNDGLDRLILSPVARAYEWVAPDFVERGVHNFFDNLDSLNDAVNAMLQGRFLEMTRSFGRFLVNSTVGLFGFLDPATEMGIEPYHTDFGHTLATWGVGSGPYIMVPFLGPRTVRSGVGSVVDPAATLEWQLEPVERTALYTLETLDNRVSLMDAEGLISGDRYVFIRDAYLQRRKHLVSDGEEVEDDFSDFEDEDGDGDEIDWEE